MSTESTDFDPYAIVLADLKAKRDQIDQAIQAIESVRSGGASPPTNASSVDAPTREGAFLGMSISEATKALLQSRRKQLNNTEILAALKAGGMVLNSADPLNTVGAVLTRRAKETGDLVKVGRGIWGLKEWYPGRSFGSKKDSAKAEDGEKPEQESETAKDVTSETGPPWLR